MQPEPIAASNPMFILLPVRFFTLPLLHYTDLTVSLSSYDYIYIELIIMRYKGCQLGKIPSEIMGQWQETFRVGAIHYCDFHHGYDNYNHLSYYMIMRIPLSSYCKKQKLQQIKRFNIYGGFMRWQDE
jgi:hypothetical protein